MSTKTVLAAFALLALGACSVTVPPPVSTTPTPVIVQTPAPAGTVVVPRAY